MGDIPDEKKEEIVELVEELYIMGIERATEVVKNLARQDPAITIDQRTAGRYIDIVRRRIRNRYKKIDMNQVLKKELRDLNYMEKRLWQSFHGEPNERSGIINSILKVKERRAKLLGMDTENVRPGVAKTLEDLLKDDDEKNESTTDRRTVVDTKQAGGEGKV